MTPVPTRGKAGVAETRTTTEPLVNLSSLWRLIGAFSARDGQPPTLDGYQLLLQRLAAGRPAGAATSALVDRAIHFWSKPGFDTFISLPMLRFEPFPHQLRAASTVLRRMRGRAILADEVGLGKTIEAGIVLSELRLRGLARKALVLAPTGVVEQWRDELERKFDLPTEIVQGSIWQPGLGRGDDPVLIASVAAARRETLAGVMTATPWDLVIVDEAHRLKNPKSASAKLVRAIRTRYLLLLTATPVENRLADLYQVVNLVQPGRLGTPRDFRSRHGEGAAHVRNLEELRGKLAEVMVRHRRSELELMLPRRLAQTLRIEPAPDEMELYQAVSERVRQEGRGARPDRALTLGSIQRLAGSSARALAPTLAKVGWDDLARRAEEMPAGRKALALLDLLRRHRSKDEKVIVFSAYRRSLELLAELTEGAGIETALYHGALTRRSKEEQVRRFEGEAPVLLTTEAGGEGRNLQFCHVMVNFDVPWNPMQIEQRLGRIHRIGQEHEVLVTNLVSRGTLEDAILSVLEAKINLFELVVGELDMILGNIEDDFDFERFVYESHIASEDEADLGSRLEVMGDQLARARKEYLDGRGRVDALVVEPNEE